MNSLCLCILIVVPTLNADGLTPGLVDWQHHCMLLARNSTGERSLFVSFLTRPPAFVPIAHVSVLLCSLPVFVYNIKNLNVTVEEERRAPRAEWENPL